MRLRRFIVCALRTPPAKPAPAAEAASAIEAVWSRFTESLRRGDYAAAHGQFSAESRAALPYAEFVEEYSPLSAAVAEYFESAKRDSFELLKHDRYEDVDGEHGRIESRCYDVLYEASWLDPKDGWGGLSAVGRVYSERSVNGMTSREKRYYILSSPMAAKAFASAVRNHWGIENKLHWALDMAFREDECRARRGNSAENLAILRHMALNLLKQNTTVKLGIKSKRKAAEWDNDYLRHLLNGNLDA